MRRPAPTDTQKAPSPRKGEVCLALPPPTDSDGSRTVERLKGGRRRETIHAQIMALARNVLSLDGFIPDQAYFTLLPLRWQPTLAEAPLGARVYDEVVAVMPTGCQTSGVLTCECWPAPGGGSSTGGPMALSSESERILEQAVAGIPRIAKVIANFPVEFREGALELAERRYQQTVCDLGYAEADAQGWISVVMFRLRRQVTELSTKKLDGNGSEAEKSVRINKGG